MAVIFCSKGSPVVSRLGNSNDNENRENNAGKNSVGFILSFEARFFFVFYQVQFSQ